MVDRDRQFCYSQASFAWGSGHFCLTLHVAMQLGLYLPGLSALSGVESLRILNGYELFPSDFPVLTETVHRERFMKKCFEAGVRPMVA